MAEVDMRRMGLPSEQLTEETYRLYANCFNCGSEHVAVFRKGDKHPMGHQGKPCPECGVSDWNFGGLVSGEVISEPVPDAVPLASSPAATRIRALYGGRNVPSVKPHFLELMEIVAEQLPVLLSLIAAMDRDREQGLWMHPGTVGQMYATWRDLERRVMEFGER